MSIRQQDIPSDFQALVDRMFGDFPFVTEMQTRLAPFTSAPPLDVYEKNGKYLLDLAVPGYEPDEINIEVNGNAVTVSGSHSETSEKKDAKYHRKEIRKGSFTRVVTLPQDIDVNNVEASIDKGVLTITLTPLKPIEPKKVLVKPTKVAEKATV
jgi:HSP20 family protein